MSSILDSSDKFFDPEMAGKKFKKKYWNGQFKKWREIQKEIVENKIKNEMSWKY